MLRKPAKELHMSKNEIKTTLGTRVATWDKIGTALTATSLQDALVQSHLDYHVAKQPLFTSVDGIMQNVASHSACVGDDGIVRGVVRSSYQVINNDDAFSIADTLAQEGNLQFMRGGETYRHTPYLIMALPEVKVAGDDMKLYFILQNAFSGQQSLRASIVPLRIVCQNQFAVAFKESSNTITIRHCGDTQSRIEEARYILGCAGQYLASFQAFADKMAVLKVGKTEVDAFLDAMFAASKVSENKTVQARNEIKIADFMDCYRAEDNANFVGTAWGLLNAWTDYNTHNVGFQPKATSADKKFINLIAPGTEKAAEVIAQITGYKAVV